MNRDRSTHFSSEEIETQAAAWILREDRGMTAAEQDAYIEWIAADPRHANALDRHRAHWNRLDMLGQWRPEHSAQPNPDLLAPTAKVVHFPVRWIAGFSLAAAAIAMGIFWRLPREEFPVRSPAPIHVATIETQTLPDGSVVELNRGASISYNFTPSTRRVVLQQGEAHFTVTHNAARPFIVSAQGVDVRAVGTAFNVRLGREIVEVLVTEGKVRVDQSGVPGTGDRVVVPALMVGERTVVPLAVATAVPKVARVSSEEVNELLAWQPKLLDYTSSPLRAIVAEFNRCNAPIHLVVPDADLAELEISASLRSDNVEGFIRMLGTGFGVQAERNGDTITLRRR